MKLRLLLAKYAEVQAGMLYGAGIGWREIGPDPATFTIAALMEVGWDETNRPMNLQFLIVDADGQPFQVPGPAGDQPFQIAAQFDVGRPPGATPGRSFSVPLAINLGAVPFRPGSDYLVRAVLDGTVLDETPFSVRRSPPQHQPPPPD